jgi:hypothetical protein
MSATPATRAIDRISDVSPWATLDGTVAVAVFAVLESGALTAAIHIDENGMPSTNHAWTGTNSDMSAGNECNDWTSSSILNIGLAGVAAAADATWTENGNSSCNASYSLYCFEQ